MTRRDQKWQHGIKEGKILLPRFLGFLLSLSFFFAAASTVRAQTVKAPEELWVECKGSIDLAGVQWCPYSPYNYGARVYTLNGGAATVYFRIPKEGGNLVTYTKDISGSGDSDIPQSVVFRPEIVSLVEGPYTWEVWASGPGWESGHSSGSFRVDTTAPNPGPGTPSLTGNGTWIVNWGNNGSDIPSGLFTVRLLVIDNGVTCSANFDDNRDGVLVTAMRFRCWDSELAEYTYSPKPGHTYTFEVRPCDYASDGVTMDNCASSTGSYTAPTPTPTPGADNPPWGTLSVSPNPVAPGGTVTITVTGNDDKDVWEVDAYYKGAWDIKLCDGTQTTCTKTWTTSYATGGTYVICGYIWDSAFQGSETTPYCLDLVVGAGATPTPTAGPTSTPTPTPTPDTRIRGSVYESPTGNCFGGLTKVAWSDSVMKLDGSSQDSLSDGEFLFTNVSGGSHSLWIHTPSSSPPGTLPSGYSCSDGWFCGSNTCPGDATVFRGQTYNFWVTPYEAAWFQTKGGDVGSQGDIKSEIPASSLSFSQDKDGYPGVVAYKEGSSSDFGDGSVSSKGWLAESGYSGRTYNYAFFAEKIENPQTLANNPSKDTLEQLDSGFYKVEGDLTLPNPNGSTWTIGLKKAQQIVILVTGNLNIKGQVAIIGGQQNFIAFIVQGNILLSTEGMDASETQQKVEGVYIADGTISTNKSDKQLKGRGVFVGWGGFSLKRDLGETNKTTPAESFEYDINLLMKAPTQVMHRPFVWEEIAP